MWSKSASRWLGGSFDGMATTTKGSRNNPRVLVVLMILTSLVDHVQWRSS